MDNEIAIQILSGLGGIIVGALLLFTVIFPILEKHWPR